MDPSLIKKIDIERKFANAAYKNFTALRYGMTPCCITDMEEAALDKQICDWQDLSKTTEIVQPCDQEGVVTTGGVTVYMYSHTLGANDPNATEEQTRSRIGANAERVTFVTPGSILEKFVTGSIGEQSFVAGTTTVELEASGPLVDMKQLSTLGSINFGASNKMLVILLPNTVDLANKPEVMYDSPIPGPLPLPALKTYALYANATVPGTAQSGLLFFDTTAPINGHKKWIAIFTETGSSGNYPYSYYGYLDNPS